MSIPLKHGAKIIAEYTISWWNAPEAEGGAGMKPLDQVDLSTFYPRLTSNRFEPLGENARWRLNARDDYDNSIADIGISSPYFGYYFIDILPPHHIRLRGRLSWKASTGLVQFETEIDLSGSIEDVKIRTKYGWRTKN